MRITIRSSRTQCQAFGLSLRRLAPTLELMNNILDIAHERKWDLWLVFWCIGIPIKAIGALYNYYLSELDTYFVIYIPVATLGLWWCWSLVRTHMNVKFKVFGYAALFVAAASAHNIIRSFFY